jgi:hypothetical protein
MSLQDSAGVASRPEGYKEGIEIVQGARLSFLHLQKTLGNQMPAGVS